MKRFHPRRALPAGAAVIFRTLASSSPRLEARVEAFTVSRAHAAVLSRKGMPHRQPAAGIINKWAALNAAHGSMHAFFLPIQLYYYIKCGPLHKGAKPFFSKSAKICPLADVFFLTV